MARAAPSRSTPWSAGPLTSQAFRGRLLQTLASRGKTPTAARSYGVSTPKSRVGAACRDVTPPRATWRFGCASGGRAAACPAADSIQNKKGIQTLLLMVMLLAVGMVLADGILTPAISVTSAVQGIQFNASISNGECSCLCRMARHEGAAVWMHPDPRTFAAAAAAAGAVIGISCAILVLLFASQQFGSQRVSFLFSPLVVIWFCSNAAIGVYNIVKHDTSVFKGLSPSYIYYYWAEFGGYQAWRHLGSVMLAISGCEALYADLGESGLPALCKPGISFVLPYCSSTKHKSILKLVGAGCRAFWAAQHSGENISRLLRAIALWRSRPHSSHTDLLPASCSLASPALSTPPWC